MDKQTDRQADQSENITYFFGGGNKTIMTMRAASHNTVNSLFYKYVSFTYYRH